MAGISKQIIAWQLLFCVFIVPYWACTKPNKSSTCVHPWQKSKSKFMNFGTPVYNDTICVLPYKMYDYLSPPDFYKSEGFMFANGQKYLAFDSCTQKVFTLFDFGMTAQDTVYQEAPWEVYYPSRYKITLDSSAYVPEWQDTAYVFRYIGMGNDRVVRDDFRIDWVWCVSKQRGIYSIYFDFVNEKYRFVRHQIGISPPSWNIRNGVTYYDKRKISRQ